MPTPPSLFQHQRIRLCAPRPEDAEKLARWTEDADYIRQLDTDYARPVTVEDMAKRMNESGPNSVYFHIRTLDTDQFIGFVVLHSIEWNNQCGLLAIGIGEPEFRGHGYSSEALQLIINYAFRELNLNRIGLDVISTNPRAIRAYQKAGFQMEGTMRQAVLRDGQPADRIIMGILRSEWKG